MKRLSLRGNTLESFQLKSNLMRIVITGSPGTGKSEISKKLSKRLGLELVDIKNIVNLKKLRGKRHDVNLKHLSRTLTFLKYKKNYLIEGHLACEIKLPMDFIFVLRTHPAILRRRLAKRKYNKKKLEENLLAEMLDYCTQRVEQEYKKKPIELDTSHRTVTVSVFEIEKAIKQKKKKLDSVNYSKELRSYLRLGRF